MPLLRDGQRLYDAVMADGLPRIADADDGSQHVLYLDGEIVRSVEAKDWSGPLPADPTPAESAAAIQAREATRVAARERRRARIRQAQSAVGVKVGDLNPAQLRALTEILLLRAGALDADLAVRPLAQWVDE